MPLFVAASRGLRLASVRTRIKTRLSVEANLECTLQMRVHDSTADLRYMVLPMRPTGTRGWTEAELQGLVTRDSMIGVRLIASPSATQA
jgi:nitrile hydratase